MYDYTRISYYLYLEMNLDKLKQSELKDRLKDAGMGQNGDKGEFSRKLV